MARRTKIVATIGPASDSPQVLRAMVEAGMDVARLGLAHGSLDESIARFHAVRAAADDIGRAVGILVDLPGPKVRLASFEANGVTLETGSEVLLVPGRTTSDARVLGVDYEQLLDDVRPGDVLAVGDGAVLLRVDSIDGDRATAQVTFGGSTQGRPGLHVPSDRLRMHTPTPDDLVKLEAFLELNVDMVAVSFVRTAADLHRLGVATHPEGPLVIAKIETRSAVEHLDSIIEASGGIMVARGDLGTELGIEELPHLQKRIIRECIALGRPIITATQMLESMVTAPQPTRAEVSDVANAVFDGSSALMLSGETAVGVDPVNAVQTMSNVAARADAGFDYEGWARRIRQVRRVAVGSGEARITDAMTAATWRAATESGVSAIICISDSGFTVRSIARFRPEMPIIGFSPNPRTVRQLTLSWGTTPVGTASTVDNLRMMDELVAEARDLGYVRSGDLVAALAGAGGHRTAATDVLRLLRVP
ncbi:MAG: pyruvate kinase [Actinomycetes bacterium]